MIEFFRSIAQTFYSQSFYARLVHHEKGIGAKFIWFQVLLSLAVLLVTLLPKMSSVQGWTENVFDRLPEVTIKNHQLSIDRPSPYAIDVMQNSDTGHAYIVFDTTLNNDSVMAIDHTMKEKHIIAFVTADFIAIQKNMKSATSPIEIHNIRDYSMLDKEVKVTHDQWVGIGKKLLVWGAPALFIFMILFLFIGAFVVTFLKALALALVTLFMALKLNIADAMRLGAATTIPGSIFGALIGIFHLQPPPYLNLVIWIVFAVYGLFCAEKYKKVGN